MCFKSTIKTQERRQYLRYLNNVMRVFDQPNIFLLKVNNRNTRKRCEICSKLTIKTPERHYWHRSGVFIANVEHISHLVLVFLLLTLKMSLLAWEVSSPNFTTIIKRI